MTPQTGASTLKIKRVVAAAPAIAPAPRALGLDPHAEAPARSVPEAREEAVRRLVAGGNLIGGHLPAMAVRN